MPGVNVTWSESAPADGDNAGLGAQEIRSLKTAVRNGLDAEHSWPSTGGAGTGAHRVGSARAFYGVESTVSSADTDGRLMVSSNRSRLFHVGSTGTMLLGSIYAPLVGTTGGALDSLPVLAQTHYWAIDSTFSVLRSLSTCIVTFPNSGYSGQPFLMANYSGAAPTELVGIHAVNNGATNCIVYGFISSGSAPAGTPFRLLSIGSRVLG